MESSKSAERPVYIYALIDPRTGETFYIGRTNRPKRRLRDHCASALSDSPTAKEKRIKAVLDANLVPYMHVLEETTEDAWRSAEQAQIALHLASGSPLTNVSPGGGVFNVHNNARPLRAWHRAHPDAIRGDNNWTRAHPELVIRGDDHPFRKHPELAARGERCHHAKLSADDVIAMRRSYRDGAFLRDLVEQYGVTEATVQKAVSGRTWAHIEEPAGRNQLYPAGERSGRAKLTEVQVREIRQLHQIGLGCRELARRFNMSSGTLSGILTGRYWKHVS